MVRTIAVLVAASLLVVAPAAQQQPAFEVASVRLRDLNSSEDPAKLLTRITPGRVELVESLVTVMLRAFEVKGHQLVLPDWAEELIVDIRAINPPGATTEQVPEMLRRLVVERFGIVTHREARSMDTYHLLVGSGGAKMRAVEALNELDAKLELFLPNGVPMTSSESQTLEGRRRVIQIEGGTRRITSRTRYDLTYDKTANTKTIDAVRMTIAELVPILAVTLDDIVIDKTGLNDIYQFRLTLPADDPGRQRAMQGMIARMTGLPAPPVNAAPFGGSPFKAIETLGLKLERRRDSVDVIVVDSMRRAPTDN